MRNNMKIEKYVTIIFLILISNRISNCNGQECIDRKTNTVGECKFISDCPTVLSNSQIGQNDYTKCVGKKRLIVCCPNNQPRQQSQQFYEQPRQQSEQIYVQPRQESERIYERKCREYQKYVNGTIFSSNLLPNSRLNKIPVDKCGLKTVKLISGGENAELTQFPHMAALGYSISGKLRFGCGGSLISERFILTAAHCMNVAEPYFARIGDVNIDTNIQGSSHRLDINIQEIIVHPNYSSERKKNDIALIKLVQNVKFDEYKRPACLPSYNDWQGDKSIATGWGNLDSADIDGSNILQQVSIQKFDENDCQDFYSRGLDKAGRPYQISYSTQICVGSRTSITDTCPGDSGSPLQVFNMKKIYCMWDIVGITSFGRGACGLQIPGIFTRVFPFVDWIENQVWN